MSKYPTEKTSKAATASPFTDRLLALQALVKELRRGESPCPWLSVQTAQSIAPYTLQESYELIETVMQDSVQGMQEELGDMLYHLLIYLDMLDEKAGVSADEVISSVYAKLVRRRAPDASTQEEAKAYWEQAKKQEDLHKKRRSPVDLAGLPDNMPALSDAAQLSVRLQGQGLDFSAAASSAKALWVKIEQEVAAGNAIPQSLAGVFLFHISAYLLQQGVLPELALREVNASCRHEAVSGASKQDILSLLQVQEDSL